ncbi:MAG TPA: HEAT repeat domain-containing protein [Candidatus Limnocylindria bacterium]|nr:HEAT repeat domain-containing protein [Candidatus Limnocylindria bacterium]
MSALAQEVAKFRQWAALRLGSDHASGAFEHGAEWECDYPDWPALYSAVEAFLLSKAIAHDRLSDHERELLLYALARDNEDEVILELLAQFPDASIQLARVAVNHPDRDARWQVAVLLGRIEGAEPVSLLLQLLKDDSEYVRRRAGTALQEIQSRDLPSPVRKV